MRAGDTRPFARPPDEPLGFRPCKPFRWLPRHGDPMCVGECIVQSSIRTLARLDVYTAVVATLSLIVLVLTH